MPRELTAEDREDLTPGELAALMGAPADEVDATAEAALAAAKEASTAAERAAEAAQDKADAADGKPAPTAEEVAAAEAAALAAKEAGEVDAEKKPEPTAEELAAVLEDDKPVAPPKPVTYKGVSDADYKTEVAKLNAEKAAAMKQLMAGEIEADAYAVIEAGVSEKRDDLVANRTLARANQEAEAHRQATLHADLQTSIGALMAASKGAALDFNTDMKAQKQFDTALRALAGDDDNTNQPPKWFVDEAHRMVKAMRGVVDAPVVKAATPAPAPVVKREVPVTLGGLPAAAPNAIGSDLRSQFALLEGEEAEEFLERLPPAQRRALSAGGMV
jgi:hypothetical protein